MCLYSFLLLENMFHFSATLLQFSASNFLLVHLIILPLSFIMHGLLVSSLNQHEQRKRQQEEMKKKEDDERKERVRKASALLQDMKKTSEKKQLEYRGITNSRAAGIYIITYILELFKFC